MGRPSKKGKTITGKATNAKIPEFGTLEYWRHQAREMAGEESDEWRISEIATMLNDVSKLLGAHWQNINTICDGNVDHSITVNFGITLNRTEQPPEVSTKISFNQKFGQAISEQVPDPDQTELPLQTSSEVPEPDEPQPEET